jgi:MFS family permease
LFLIITGTIIAIVDSLIITLSLLTVEKGLMISLFFASVSITALIVRLPCASLLNALPRIPLLAPCGILIALSMILVSFFPSNSTLVVGGILFGVGLGAGWPMYQALISDLLDPVLRPKGTATALLLYDVGFFITPLIVGYFLPRFGTSVTFAAIALVAGSILVLLEIFYWLPFYRKLPADKSEIKRR